MDKRHSFYIIEDESCNLTDQDQQETTTGAKNFQSKFIKQLNFQQNCQKRRSRRIRQINKMTLIKQMVYQKAKNQTNKQQNISSTKQNINEIYYKGHYIKGKFKKKILHGDTQILYKTGEQFKGVFKNGQMRVGRFDFKNGYEYWGQLQGKTFMGKGTLKCPDGKRITGVWNKDQITGKTEIEYSNGDIYYGETLNFFKHGEGYMFFKTGSKYIGHFQNGQIQGLGTYFQPDGTAHKGLWKNGQLLQKNAQLDESFSIDSTDEDQSFQSTALETKIQTNCKIQVQQSQKLQFTEKKNFLGIHQTLKTESQFNELIEI